MITVNISLRAQDSTRWLIRDSSLARAKEGYLKKMLQDIENNLYVSFYAPAPTKGTIYYPGFCWYYNGKYSDVYELRWIPNFIDQILVIEYILFDLKGQVNKIYTGQRHFPWTINNAFHTQRKKGSIWYPLGDASKRLKKYLDENKIELLYPKRGDIHDDIYRYGLAIVAGTLGKIVLPGHTKNKKFEPKSIPRSYNIEKLETRLLTKGIISETYRKV